MILRKHLMGRVILPGLLAACLALPGKARAAGAEPATGPAGAEAAGEALPLGQFDQRQPAASQSTNSQSGPVVEPPDKRVFGVLPNYRAARETGDYTPISVKQKFVIASKDSFDYPLLLLGAVYGGLGQWSNANPSFGQGMAGYARRFGTSYADQAIGNMMTEAIYPSILHEDPRYFMMSTGTKKSRAVYALTRIFVTRTDSGGKRFNYSEVIGNATSVAIGNSYYPDGRTAVSNLERLGQQLGTDAVAQVLKEFWPDVKNWLFHRHAASETP